MAHLATAWAIAHPDVTSAIVGPRTMAHLSPTSRPRHPPHADLLDRIDELVAPGVTLNPDDGSRRPRTNRAGPTPAIPPMIKRPLGNTGLHVSPIAIGGAAFTYVHETSGWNPRTEEGTAAVDLHACLDNGINYVDTAQAYGEGYSETLIGRVMKQQQGRVRPRQQGLVPPR